MQNKHPEKCVNCGEGIWLGAFFDGFFLCPNCDARKGEIIFKLKARLSVHPTRRSLRREVVLKIKKVARVTQTVSLLRAGVVKQTKGAQDEHMG